MINLKRKQLPDEQINFFMQNLNNDERSFTERDQETSVYLDFNQCYDNVLCFEVSMAISENYI
jgi:hypothetical protein